MKPAKMCIALFCVVLVTSSLISSCARDVSDTPVDSNASTDTASEDTQKTGIEAANLPKKDFDGREFRILTQNPSNLAHSWHLVAPDEQTGETLNDAMYLRNKNVEEYFNCRISSYYSGAVQNDATNSINAGDDEYSLIFGGINVLYPLAQNGMTMNFHNLEYTDLSAPWWDETIISDLTYKNSLYVLLGDISPSADSRVYVIIFNKDMCQDLKLEMPYQYVLDGSWTLDRFNTYISDVNYDVNGDSLMDFNDRWGFLTENGFSWMMYMSGGGQVAAKNEQGEFEIRFNTERNIRLAQKALEITLDSTKTLLGNPYVTANGGNWSVMTAWFASGGALFRSTALEPVPRDLRELDVNFGILPFPKLDDNQDRYYTLPNYSSNVISVPVTADAEFASIVLEALGAESGEVTTAFYDIVLNGKVLRDNESKDMLDIIFSTKTFDLGFFAQIANFRGILESLESKKSTDVASAYASYYDSATTSLDKMLADFDNLNK